MNSRSRKIDIILQLLWNLEGGSAARQQIRRPRYFLYEYYGFVIWGQLSPNRYRSARRNGKMAPGPIPADSLRTSASGPHLPTPNPHPHPHTSPSPPTPTPTPTPTPNPHTHTHSPGYAAAWTVTPTEPHGAPLKHQFTNKRTYFSEFIVWK